MAAEAGVVGEGEKEAVVVRWERLLARMHLRVLLVEADDSTRQIIAALLRKCGYKVAAVADGLKAWETLKERGKHIDIVLAEVELPSMSGFCLLTMIMEHESCRNIPVIMMSSRDSATVVLKCMLQGAADFLSKPIRKNELKNLWQHLWRRQTSMNSRHAELDGSQPQTKLDSIPENYAASNDGTSLQIHKVYCEEGSDTKRLTKSVTHVGMQYIHTKNSVSLHADSKEASKEGNSGESVSSPEINDTHQDKLKKPSANMSCYGQHAHDTEEEEKPFCHNYLGGHNDNMPMPYKEAMDLIGTNENQPNLNYSRETLCFTQESENIGGPVCGKRGELCISTCHPLLELSLKSSPPQGYRNFVNEEKNTLNHSNASAFSWYCKKPVKRIIPCNDNYEVIKEDQVLDNATRSPQVEISGSSHLEEPGFDSIQQLVQPMFYGQLSPQFWTVLSAGQLDELNNSSEFQSEQDICHYEQKLQLDQIASEVDVPVTNQNVNPTEEAMKIEPSPGTEGNSILYCGNKKSIGAAPAADIKTDERQYSNNITEEKDLKKSAQREAALTKFILKRKNRCFEKKVRYQSRKRLAEQRPRVKGQFVRQVCDP